MKKRIYSVYDKVGECYVAGLMLERNDAVIKRGFREALNSEKSEFSKNPAEFELHYMGDFDDEDGVLMQPDTDCPSVVDTGDQFLWDLARARLAEAEVVDA